jgi:hypothetical protein
VESRNVELTRKYEDSKKNYFKLREERERLKLELIAKEESKQEPRLDA